MFFDDVGEHSLVNRGKELSYVACQYPYSLRMIAGCLACEGPKSLYSLVHSLSEATRERVRDKCPVEKWIEHSVDSMVEQSIAHVCLMYIPRLRVRYVKGFISRVSVSFGCKVFVKGNDILHEAKLELLHILSMPLTPQKLLPCGKEIFKRDDSIISMIKSDSFKPSFNSWAKREAFAGS